MHAKSDNTSKISKFVVGLTGGIGSGKTAVSDYFASLGIDIIDADVVTHNLTQKDSPMLDVIKDAFGDWVLDDKGNYNRSAMRTFIFNHPSHLAQLNAITHPIISQTCLDLLAHSTSPYAILSVPLLIENKDNPTSLFHACDRILVVDVSPNIQLERASRRDGADVFQIQKIIDRQIDRTTRLAYADDVVDNNNTITQLHIQLLPLHQKYLALSQTHSSP